MELVVEVEGLIPRAVKLMIPHHLITSYLEGYSS